MEEATFVALRLSSEGYGSVNEIMDTPADLVMQMTHFNRYRLDYQSTHAHLNKPEDRQSH